MVTFYALYPSSIGVTLNNATTSISALQRGQISSSVHIIKFLQELSAEVKALTLRGMMVNVSSCFETLSAVLDSVGDIAESCIESVRGDVADATHYFRFLAMTKRARNCRDWFDINDNGETETNQSSEV